MTDPDMINSEITVKGPAFAAAVGWVAKWAPSKPTVPIQGGIRIALEPARPDAVHLTAFGENVTARAQVDIPGSRPNPPHTMSAVVSARLLDALAGTLGKGDVVIGPGPDDTVRLTQGRTVLTLPMLPETDWPTLPGMLTAIGEVDGDAFAAAVKRIGAAAGDVDTKPVAFACIRLGLGDGNTFMEITGATSQHAATTTIPWIIDPERAADGDYAGAGDFPGEASVIAATLVEGAASFSGPDRVAVGCDGNLLSLHSRTRALTLRTVALDKPWPIRQVHELIGAPFSHTVTIDPAGAVVPLKRALIVRGKEGAIRITFAAGELRIASAEREGRTSGTDAIDATGYDGPDMTLGINPRYLADALAAAPGDKVTVAVENRLRPIVLTCDGDPAWRHLVAPVRLPD